MTNTIFKRTVKRDRASNVLRRLGRKKAMDFYRNRAVTLFHSIMQLRIKLNKMPPGTSYYTIVDGITPLSLIEKISKLTLKAKRAEHFYSLLLNNTVHQRDRPNLRKKRDRSSKVLERLGKEGAIKFYDERIKCLTSLIKNSQDVIDSYAKEHDIVNGKWPPEFNETVNQWLKTIHKAYVKRERYHRFIMNLKRGKVAERDLKNYH